MFDKENDKNMWWGYRHSNGKSILKPWFGDILDYTTDCENNPFTVKVIPPFQANTRDEAWKVLEEKLNE